MKILNFFVPLSLFLLFQSLTLSHERIEIPPAITFGPNK